MAIAIGLAAAGALIAHQKPDSPDRDLVMLTQAAQAGESGAELQLGLAYREGRLGLASDERKAGYWIHRAALDGNTYAAGLEGTPAPATLGGTIRGFFEELGAIFSHSSVARLTADAESGDAVAQFQLAMRYRDGSWGVARDEAASRLWLERAAKGGNRPAMSALARAYDTGEHGFPRDLQQSRLWQQRASDLN